MIKTIAYGVLLVSVALARSAWAGQYKVEVVVFTQKVSGAEAPKHGAALKVPAQVLEISTSTDLGQSMVAAEPLRALTGAYDQLSQQQAYTVLLKTAWIQSTADQQTMPAVHLQNADNTLNGYITLKTGGALALQVDVSYGASSDVYRFTERQTVKANELHYFDHPAMGVIAVVTPL